MLIGRLTPKQQLSGKLVYGASGRILPSDYYFGRGGAPEHEVILDIPQVAAITKIKKDDEWYTIRSSLTLNGSQYIDTGYTPTNHTKIEIDFTHSIIENKFLFGSRTSGSSSDAFGLLYNAGVTYPMFGSSQSSVSVRVPANERHMVTLSQEGYMLDDVLIKSFSEMSFTSALSIYIGGMNQNGSISNRIFDGEIYGVRLYETSRFVRYMVPCARDSDNINGLYDFAGNRFYPILTI